MLLPNITCSSAEARKLAPQHLQGGAAQDLSPAEFAFVAAGFPLPGHLPMAWDGMNRWAGAG